jgi:hypothetical protein
VLAGLTVGLALNLGFGEQTLLHTGSIGTLILARARDV